MNKGLLMLAGIVAFSGLAGATTTSLITCSSAGGVNQATSFSATTLTCPEFNSLPIGDTLTGVTLTITDSFNQGVTGQTNAFDFTYSLLDPDIDLKNGSAPNTCVTTGVGSSTACLDVVSGTIVGGDNFQLGNEITTDLSAYLGSGSFNIGSVTGSIDPSAPTSALDATGAISVTAFETFTYTSTTGAPEPGSMILLGGGLLAAGLIGRKKLVRK